MNRFKLQGYVQEFPFLSQIIKNADAMDIDFIKIAKVDENLLSKIPSYEGATGSLVGIDTGENIHFILDNNNIIFRAVETKGYVRHNEAHTEDEEWEGETILEGIYKQDIVNRLKCIVVENFGYKINNHHSQGGLNFIIYKVAKNETLQEIIDNVKQKELTLIQAEANIEINKPIVEISYNGTRPEVGKYELSIYYIDGYNQRRRLEFPYGIIGIMHTKEQAEKEAKELQMFCNNSWFMLFCKNYIFGANGFSYWVTWEQSN